MGPEFSVIVPVRNDTAGIRELIRGLSLQTFGCERFELVIGDDGSSDGSLAGIETLDGWVRVVSGPPRTSYAARNRAARVAQGRFLAFCDSDCLPEPHWLDEGWAVLSASDVVAGEVTFVASHRPTVWSLLTMDMFLDQEQNVQLSRAVTANLFVDRRLFEELGGFDESLPSGGDYDFVRRAVARGASLAYAPLARVRHPTIDCGRPLLRKIWTTNRWDAARQARAGLPISPTTAVYVLPVLGAALARRKALRPLFRLYRQRLAAAGVAYRWRDEVRAVALLYSVVPYLAGLARIHGFLEGRRLLKEGFRASLGSDTGHVVGVSGRASPVGE